MQQYPHGYFQTCIINWVVEFLHSALPSQLSPSTYLKIYPECRTSLWTAELQETEQNQLVGKQQPGLHVLGGRPTVTTVHQITSRILDNLLGKWYINAAVRTYFDFTTTINHHVPQQTILSRRIFLGVSDDAKKSANFVWKFSHHTVHSRIYVHATSYSQYLAWLATFRIVLFTHQPQIIRSSDIREALDPYLVLTRPH